MPHTPGPYVVEETTHVTEGRYSCGVYCDDKTGSLVAQVGGFRYVLRGLEETQANARLFAAAPDMLEALRLAEAALLYEAEMRSAACDPEYSAPITAVLAKVETAIAKAEGRA